MAPAGGAAPFPAGAEPFVFETWPAAVGPLELLSAGAAGDAPLQAANDSDAAATRSMDERRNPKVRMCIVNDRQRTHTPEAPPESLQQSEDVVIVHRCQQCQWVSHPTAATRS